MIERYFKLAENQTSVRQEMLGGFTTFVTMAYVVVVNPQILSQAGVPVDGALFATCISAAVGTLVMGLYANYPIALAPGMSLNAYFTYAVCIGMGIPWRTALGVVFFSGVAFLVLTVTKIREQIVNAIPDSVKFSTAAGLGMFIAFIGLRNGKLVVANPATFVSIGSFSNHEVQIACFGLAVTLVLMTRKITGSILIGIICATLLSILSGVSKWPSPFFLYPILPQLSCSSICVEPAISDYSKFSLPSCLSICSITLGPWLVYAEQAGFVRDGKIPRVGRVLLADAVGTIFGSLTGTSTVTSYIESAAGVAAGARTGLSNLAVAALFLVAMFFSPIASAIPAYATASALIVVGALMTQSIARVDWSDFTEGAPAFITMLAMPLTFSIATGLSLGLICYTLVKLAAGKTKQITPFVSWVLTLLFMGRYVYLALH